jgi:hypothetical protein
MSRQEREKLMTDSDASSGGARHGRTVVIAGVLAVVAATAGCSSSGGEPPAARPAPSTTAAAPAPTPAAVSASNGATVTAIKATYIKFFNPATSLKVSMTLLQDGPAFRKTLKEQAKTDFAKSTTATVSTVTMNTPSRATVVYTLLVSGSPVLVNTIGTAVQESGNWKVSGSTFCGLLTAQGPAPKVCAQAAAP